MNDRQKENYSIYSEFWIGSACGVTHTRGDESVLTVSKANLTGSVSIVYYAMVQGNFKLFAVERGVIAMPVGKRNKIE